MRGGHVYYKCGRGRQGSRSSADGVGRILAARAGGLGVVLYVEGECVCVCVRCWVWGEVGTLTRCRVLYPTQASLVRHLPWYYEERS